MTSEAWWDIWWPWMLVWLLTAAGLVALLALTLFRLLRDRRPGSRRIIPGICFYLHDRTVMDHYQMRGYAAALRREVEQRTSDSKDGSVHAKVFGLSAGGGKRDNSEIVSKYLEVAEPISVIGIIMDVLEEKDVIVHVDLVNRTVRRNGALVNALATLPGAGARAGTGAGTRPGTGGLAGDRTAAGHRRLRADQRAVQEDRRITRDDGLPRPLRRPGRSRRGAARTRHLRDGRTARRGRAGHLLGTLSRQGPGLERHRRGPRSPGHGDLPIAGGPRENGRARRTVRAADPPRPSSGPVLRRWGRTGCSPAWPAPGGS